jgi:AmpD protein
MRTTSWHAGDPAYARRTRLAIDGTGYANLARQIRSPNHDARPEDVPVTLVVVHGISVPAGVFGGDGVARLFTNRLDPAMNPECAAIAHLRVSAHFFVRRNGTLVQFVSCNDRAWHAGASSWQGREQCNDFSIGVELEGTDQLPYATAQYTMLSRLLKVLARRYPIAHVAGHSDVAPGRKTDPGPSFDWLRLRRLTAPRRA